MIVTAHATESGSVTVGRLAGAGGTLTDGPILLVPTCELPAVVADELARLHPGEVIALGGPAAVCDDVLTAAAIAAEGTDGDPGDPDGDRPDHVR